MDNNGWIKVHRKMLDNPIVWKDAEHLAVWMYLLLNASHADHPAIFNGQKIILKSGQLITGRKKIAESTKVSESKIRRILKTFKIDQQIDQQTCPSSTLISLLNWDTYQKSDQESDQRVTNNRPLYKKNKNERNIYNSAPDPKRFNNFNQRQYDFDELEKDALGKDG